VHWLDQSHHLPLPYNPLTTHLKQLQEDSSFHFIYVCEAHQPYSLTFISSIYHPPPTNYPTHTTYFILLSFIINSKLNVQRCFYLYPHCEYTLLLSIQLFCYSPLLFPFHYFPLFKTFHYTSVYPHLHRCILILLTPFY
jgi:hypothetical protein